jgi:hypothetical protein
MDLLRKIYLKKHILFIRIIACSLVVVFVGCGKNQDKNKSGVQRDQDEITREIERVVAKQTIECARNADCPEAIAKVVVVDGDKIRTCTGFLVSTGVVATSSSCLTLGLRISEHRCSGEIITFFPKIGAKPARRMECESIISASQIVGSNPTNWRSDIAYYKLKDSIGRRPLFMSREGAFEGKSVRAWKVDMLNDFEAVITSQSCSIVHGSYINPLAETPFSPQLMLSGCDFNKGNRGSPILSGNRWIGLFSQFVDRDLISYIESTGLLQNGLKPLLHASNAVCLPSPFDDEDTTPDEVECSKLISDRVIDEKRSLMLNSSNLFKMMISKVQSYLEKVRPYLKWDVKTFNRDGLGALGIEFKPRCFVNVKDWIRTFSGDRRVIYSFEQPEYLLKISFDQNAKIQPLELEEKLTKFFVQFSVKELQAPAKSSYVYVWPENQQNIFSSSLSENCL